MSTIYSSWTQDKHVMYQSVYGFTISGQFEFCFGECELDQLRNVNNLSFLDWFDSGIGPLGVNLS